MEKEKMINLFGNVLLGIACPFLFLLSEDPFNTLFCEMDSEEEKKEQSKNDKEL